MLLTHCRHYPGHTRVCHHNQSTWPTRWHGLGLLCPCTRAAPDSIITMMSACRNALHCFRIHKDLPNFPIHQTIGALFNISTNTTSKILHCFHCLLPHIAEVTCAPSIPPPDGINHFIKLVSPKSARSRLKLHLNGYLSHSLYNDVFSDAPDHFHLLPSLLSSQTSYPLIGLCQSNQHNRTSSTGNLTQLSNGNYNSLYTRLPTNQFVLLAPLFFGNHILKCCTSICKIGVHNAIRDGFAHALAPVLSTVGFFPPNSTVDTEPNLYLPSDPHSCPFDFSFTPYYPAPPPLTSHGCTSHTVGTNITISSLPPKLPLGLNSPYVVQIISANADSHPQKYERKKLDCTNKTNPSTSIITRGDTLIGNLLHRSMLLIPFVMFGRSASPKLPFRPPPSTTTPVPTFQTKCHPNGHTITAISKSQRHPSLGKSQLVAPSHTMFLWTLLSCTHSFY